MNYYCIASDFKNETICAYSQLNQENMGSQIIETYGQITHNNIFEGGRVLKDIPDIDLQKLKDYIAFSKIKNIAFNYSLNGSCMGNRDLTTQGILDLVRFLDDLKYAGVTRITVSIPSLIELIRSHVPEMEIKLSIINQVNTVNKIKEYEKMGVSRIVIDESYNRNFDRLKRFQKAFKGEIELIVNSLCHKDCIYRNYHYNQTAHDSIPSIQNTASSYYNHRCMLKRASSAEEILKLCWIRPEDIHYYSEIGINHFKLQGRHTVYHGDPVRTVQAYFSGKYEGNLLDLLELFNSPYHFKVNLQNTCLDGFITHFLKPESCISDCESCQYCAAFLQQRFDVEKFNKMNNTATRFYKEIDEYQKIIDKIAYEKKHMADFNFYWD